MATYRLVTFDAYSGLADFRTTLLPAIARELPQLESRAEAFLSDWRAKQLEAAALSNALRRGRVSFHECTAWALDAAAYRHEV